MMAKFTTNINPDDVKKIRKFCEENGMRQEDFMKFISENLELISVLYNHLPISSKELDDAITKHSRYLASIQRRLDDKDGMGTKGLAGSANKRLGEVLTGYFHSLQIGEVKRLSVTTLAKMARTNYNTAKRYLDSIGLLEWVLTNPDLNSLIENLETLKPFITESDYIALEKYNDESR